MAVIQTPLPSLSASSSRAVRAGLDATRPDHSLWIALLNEDEEGVLAALAAGADPNSGAPEVATQTERRERMDWAWQTQGTATRLGSGWALASAAESLMVRAVHALLEAGANPFFARPQFAHQPIPNRREKDKGSPTDSSSNGFYAGKRASSQDIEWDALCCALAASHYKGDLEDEVDKLDAIATALWQNMQQRATRGEVSQEQLHRWGNHSHARHRFVAGDWAAALWMARQGLFHAATQTPDPLSKRPEFGMTPQSVLHTYHFGGLLGRYEWGKIALLCAADPTVLSYVQDRVRSLHSGGADRSRVAIHANALKTIESCGPLDLNASEPWRLFSRSVGLPQRKHRAVFGLSAHGVVPFCEELLAVPKAIRNEVFEQTLKQHWASPIALGHAQWECNQRLLEHTLGWLDTDSALDSLSESLSELKRPPLVENRVPEETEYSDPQAQASALAASTPAFLGVDRHPKNGEAFKRDESSGIACGGNPSSSSPSSSSPSSPNSSFSTDNLTDRLADSKNISLRRQRAFWDIPTLFLSRPLQCWLVQQAAHRMCTGQWSTQPFFDTLFSHAHRAQKQYTDESQTQGLGRAMPTVEQLPAFMREAVSGRMGLVRTFHKEWHAPLRAFIRQSIQQDLRMALEWLRPNLLLAHAPVETSSPSTRSTPDPHAAPSDLPSGDATRAGSENEQESVRHWFDLALRHGSVQCAEFMLERIPVLQTALLGDAQWLEQAQQTLSHIDPLSLSDTGPSLHAHTACTRRLHVLAERVALANTFPLEAGLETSSLCRPSARSRSRL